MTEIRGNEELRRERSDPLANMPSLLRRWAEKKGLERLLASYGRSICRVCGRIGIRWYTAKSPSGVNLEFESQVTGWLHPPGDGTAKIYGRFGMLWEQAEEESKKTGESIEEIVAGLEQPLFDGFMTAVANTSWITRTFDELKNGSTNPFDYCVSPRTVLWSRQGGKRGTCPKCGEPGTGEGVVGKERRFFHESNRSCYLGMVNPVRKEVPLVKCAKCGEEGKKSISKGYSYIRHKNKTCYLGKLSDEIA